MNPKTIFEELKRESDEIMEESYKVMTAVGDWISVSDFSDEYEEVIKLPLDPKEWGWKATGWLLERLPEWEDLTSFANYYGGAVLSFSGKVSLPISWLTSPSILPEKIGEYLAQRGEKDGDTQTNPC